MIRKLIALLLSACTTPQVADTTTSEPEPAPPPVSVRVASYNTTLYQVRAGQLAERLRDTEWDRAVNFAEILQEIRPDIILLNEVDTDMSGEVARRLREDFLAVSQGGREPLDYPYIFLAPSNTGVHTGLDLNQDGRIVTTPGSPAYAEDCHGFGTFEGQYGMLVLSRYPIVQSRTFQHLLWKDMPDPGFPNDPETGEAGGFYPDEVKDILRLSSKSHWDLTLDVAGHPLHLLASHPTPPAFDGPEQRNVHRNTAEVRFWADYLSEGAEGWMVDDEGVRGGMGEGSFVIVGDLNADPHDGTGSGEGSGIVALVNHPRTYQGDPPRSNGAVEASQEQGGVNEEHVGDPAHDTSDWNPRGPGNLRVDYALPSADLTVEDSGVFWPATDEPGRELLGFSDHHAVWVQIRLGQGQD
ncbi:MAG: endonuclease/exonuclease/phosphatase family protein [Deltaproteobacteria bacterium]|nr:MAG: endonuclease/exonuclease/phosphatase family protein [Deltaproteobacteria bacterium]